MKHLLEVDEWQIQYVWSKLRWPQEEFAGRVTELQQEPNTQESKRFYVLHASCVLGRTSKENRKLGYPLQGHLISQDPSRFHFHLMSEWTKQP